LYEFLVHPEMEGRPLSDLIPDEGCVIAALSRAGRAVIPTPDMLLMESDAVLVSATLDGSEALRQRIRSIYEGGTEKEKDR
jgi:Trk K+ transport system NAD-binding subunit